VIRRQLKAWLRARIIEHDQFCPTTAGTPQGGSITLPTKLQTYR
jgi:retron-type reverse transcriptase